MRGTGVVVKVGSAVHTNFSTAFIKCIEDIVKMYNSVQLFEPSHPSTLDLHTHHLDDHDMQSKTSVASSVASSDDEDDESQSSAINQLFQNRNIFSSRRKISNGQNLSRKEKRRMLQRRGSFVPSDPLPNPDLSPDYKAMYDQGDIKAEHLRFPPLDDHVRVGFSILNLVSIKDLLHCTPAICLLYAY